MLTAQPHLPFKETPPEAWSVEREQLLQRQISDMGLKIEGTYLERIIGRLYEELAAAGIKLRPKVYLSNEWSCPDGVPVIGIPFYLADPRLARIEDEMMDGVEAQTEEEILSFLRHEAGHAFNYAYKLYETEAWRALFGEMSLPYVEDYRPRPFSRAYVRHIPGWYAQKHPDEDFSESFAVWLTPNSQWREIYRDWPCLEKLQYVDDIVRELGQAEPIVTGNDYDFASEAMIYSVADHYQRTMPESSRVPSDFDLELRYIFRARDNAENVVPAHTFLAQRRRLIVGRIAYWTGLYDVQVRALIQHLIERSEQLSLKLSAADSETVLADFVAFASTLCMNRLYHGEYVFNRGPG
jgi:hypothetical protein